MFTIMTWNVENFFAPTADDQAAWDAKLDDLATVITAAAPDLLAVQEIGDEFSFDALRTKLGGSWTGVLATHFAPDHPIRVGWLTTGSLEDVQEVVDLPAALAPVKVDDTGATTAQLGRGALAVTYVGADGTRVRALNAHLKSKLLEYPDGRFYPHDEDERARYGAYALDRRAAEAATVREWATASLAGEWAGERLLVCGDLNDTVDAATTQLIFGPPGSQLGTAGFPHPDTGDAQRLWDVGYAMQPPNDYSRINEGRPELIDHILVSHALVGTLQDAQTIPIDHLPSIGPQPQVTPRVGGPPSDHRPAIAHFDAG